MKGSTCFEAIFALLLTITECSNAGETRRFSPSGAVRHLRVTSDVEGDISWQSNSASNVILEVTLSTDDPSSTEPVIDFTEDEGTSTVVLNVQRSKTSSAVTWSAGLMATVGVALLASVFATRLSTPASCLLLVGVFVCASTALHVSADGSVQRADIAILIPRDYSFESIVLTSMRGGISIDKALLGSDPNIKCLTGSDREECGGCCQANGQCIDGRCQCKSGFTGDECETQTDTSFTLNDDPSDPVIMTLRSVDGEQLQILGDKDSTGIASKVNSLVFDGKKGVTTFVSLNENTSLPDKVSTESGVQIQLEWREDLSMVHVTAVSPDGKLQVTVNVDLNVTADNVNVKRDVKEQKSVHQTARTKRQSGDGNVASIPVTVYQCGEPETEARVYGQALLSYDEDIMQWTGEKLYQAVSTDTDGVYHIQVFTGTQSPIAEDIENVCKLVVAILGGSCQIASIFTEAQEKKVCNEIEQASRQLTTAISGDFDVVTRACDAAFRAFRLYCNTFTEVSSTGGQSVTDSVCGSVSLSDSLIDLFETETIFFLPYAEFPDGNRVEAAGQVIEIPPGATGLLPHSFTLQDDMAEPVITSLIVSPEDPLPREDYVVNVTYICPTESLNVTMDIVGTDNYTNLITCTGLTYLCSLEVPGAEELVRDLVTVNLRDPEVGFSLTRQVIVVF